jgi:glucokinase
MADQIDALLQTSGINLNEIHSIGIGVPGLVNFKTGRVIYCTNLSWYDVALTSELHKKFDVPIFVENDATVAALAESMFGSTKGVADSVFLTLGTGIGGGIVIDHKIFSGAHGAGSEIGHTIIGENFYNCNCGNNGCFETFASATAMIKYAKHRIETGSKSEVILNAAGGNIENINAKIIFDAAKSGDPLAIEVVDRMVKYLAIGILNIYNMLDPDMIALGGGVSQAGQYLIDMVKNKVKHMVLSKHVQYGDIVIAKLGNEAGIVGAAFLGNQGGSICRE